MEKGKKTLCMILSLGTAISFWKLHQLFERDACCKQIGSSLPERWKHFSLKPKKKNFGLFYFIRIRCTVPLRMLSKIYEWMNCTLPIVAVTNSSTGNSARSLHNILAYEKINSICPIFSIFNSIFMNYFIFCIVLL